MAELAPQRRPPTRKDVRIGQLDRLCTALRADLEAVAVALESWMMATEGEKRVAYEKSEEALARPGVKDALEKKRA